MPREATSLNTWAIALGRALEARGVDVPELFEEVGLGADVLRQPNGRHSVSAMGRLWKKAVAITGDACIGLHVSQFVQPTTFVSLGLAILASDTLEDAMRRGTRFSRVMTDAVDLDLRETPEGLRQRVRFREGIVIGDEAIDLYMASSVKMGLLLTGQQVRPTKMWRRHRPSRDVQKEHEAYFDAPIEFGAETDSFIVPYELVRRPLPMANPALALSSDEAVRTFLAAFDGSRLADKVREAVIRRLSLGEPQRADVAKSLHVGEKTLQRRLADEGTTFQKLVDETRDELARLYVIDASIPLAEVAFRLGFAEQSGFARAFKRWTGRSPSEFREHGPAAI